MKILFVLFPQYFISIWIWIEFVRLFCFVLFCSIVDCICFCFHLIDYTHTRTCAKKSSVLYGHEMVNSIYRVRRYKNEKKTVWFVWIWSFFIFIYILRMQILKWKIQKWFLFWEKYYSKKLSDDILHCSLFKLIKYNTVPSYLNRKRFGDSWFRQKNI